MLSGRESSFEDGAESGLESSAEDGAKDNSQGGTERGEVIADGGADSLDFF